MDDTTNGQIAPLIHVVSQIRQHLKLQPEDFPIALARVVKGSDGTAFQDSYCTNLEVLIGSHNRGDD